MINHTEQKFINSRRVNPKLLHFERAFMSILLYDLTLQNPGNMNKSMFCSTNVILPIPNLKMNARCQQWLLRLRDLQWWRCCIQWEGHMTYWWRYTQWEDHMTYCYVCMATRRSTTTHGRVLQMHTLTSHYFSPWSSHNMWDSPSLLKE